MSAAQSLEPFGAAVVGAGQHQFGLLPSKHAVCRPGSGVCCVKGSRGVRLYGNASGLESNMTAELVRDEALWQQSANGMAES